MIRYSFHCLVMTASLLVPPTTVAGSEETDPAQQFKDSVLPVLRQRCCKCHGSTKQESNLRLDDLSTDLINDRAATEKWHAVLQVLNAGEMPPEDEPQLTEAEHAIVTKWVGSQIAKAVEARRTTDGRVTMRRLNRVEYQNTMTDLLGMEMDYARDLPPDAVSADGFTNNGRSLQMSAIQLEYYLATARRALDRLIVSGEAPRVFDYTFPTSNLKKWLGKPVISNRLQRRELFLATIVDEYPEAGDFLIRVQVKAELVPQKGYPLLQVSVGYRPDTQILLNDFELVEVTSSQMQTFEFRGRLENFPLPVRGQGKYPGLVIRLRNMYDDGSPLPTKPKTDPKSGIQPEPNLPTLDIQSVEFHGPLYEQWPPASHRRILFDSSVRKTDESAYVTEVLKRFMPRAFRRDVTENEVAKLVGFFQLIRPDFPTFEEAIRETLAFTLIQPDFLYLLEPAGDIKREINDWELASRLSYFLWTTMPDDRLLELAANKQLSQPLVLKQQVERLLNDLRSERFVRQFTEQWLHLKDVNSVAVSRDLYPSFDNDLKKDMVLETQMFFAEALRHNLTSINLLSSNFSMLNERLARHYGVEGVLGNQFRRVPLSPDGRRGGLLGHASILLTNSTGADAHPVRRAVWIRDRLLNDPPAPPPPDVPSLDDATDPDFLKLPVREQLSVHRQKVACNRCHRYIDPWGIALENFDAVGLWRTETRRTTNGQMKTFPVVAKDTFPNGREVDGAYQLKQLLLAEHKNQFARSLVIRLLTYALGRQPELSDQQAIDDLTAEFAANDYQLRDLIQKVVASSLFRTK